MICNLVAYAAEITQIADIVEEAANVAAENSTHFLGMEPKDSLSLCVTILGFIVTILCMRAQFHRENKRIRSDASKAYYSEMMQLIHKLIIGINTAKTHASIISADFDLDPGKSNDNNLFEHFKSRSGDTVDSVVTNKTDEKRKDILETYKAISSKYHEAPRETKQIDQQIWILIKHIEEALIMDKNKPLKSDYKTICKTPFPTIEKLCQLRDNITKEFFQ